MDLQARMLSFMLRGVLETERKARTHFFLQAVELCVRGVDVPLLLLLEALQENTNATALGGFRPSQSQCI